MDRRACPEPIEGRNACGRYPRYEGQTACKASVETLCGASSPRIIFLSPPGDLNSGRNPFRKVHIISYMNRVYGSLFYPPPDLPDYSPLLQHSNRGDASFFNYLRVPLSIKFVEPGRKLIADIPKSSIDAQSGYEFVTLPKLLRCLIR